MRETGTAKLLKLTRVYMLCKKKVKEANKSVDRQDHTRECQKPHHVSFKIEYSTTHYNLPSRHLFFISLQTKHINKV